MQEKVNKAFGDEDIESADKFLDLTLSSWAKVSDAIGRNVVFILVLAVVFEILVSSKASGNFAIGSLTFGNAPIVQQFLPVAIAYLVYDTYALIGYYDDQGSTYAAIMQTFHPKLYRSGLPFYVLTPIRGPFSIYMLTFVGVRAERRVDKFDENVRLFLAATMVVILPIAFECQAYYSLIQKYGFAAINWISMVASLLFTAGWIVRVYLNYSERPRRSQREHG